MDSVSEGIGYSQVLAYVEKLAHRGLNVDLHTFEKKTPEHSLEQRLRAAGVRWHRHRFGSFGSLGGLQRVVRGALAIQRANLVHARSDLAAASALLARSSTWVWDFRSFYVDQKIELGELRAGGIQEKVLRLVEARAADRAAAIIALTREAIPEMENLFGRAVKNKTLVITTCVDTDVFEPAEMPTESPLRLLLAGTINKYYDIDLMLRLLEEVRRRKPAELIVSIPDRSREDARLIAAADSVEMANPADMPAVIARAHVGLSVCRSDAGISLKGSMPTKIGEFLATGRPVIVNEGLGDAGSMLREKRCGVSLAGRAPHDIQTCLDELEALLADPRTPERCRALAEEHFALDKAIDALIDLYKKLGN